MVKHFIAAGALVAIAGVGASAQTAALRNVISIQPLNVVFQVYTGEFERTFAKAATWGVGGTTTDFADDANYSSAEFKVRYYPAGVALNGFSFGGSAGFSRVSTTDFNGREESAGGPSFGVLLEYQWLMGDKKNVAVTLGAGAKVLNIDEEEFSSTSVTVRYPTGRISIGFAF
ncbi:MAG: hypothetical protein P3A28_06500 [Gemmatimonadota bacterium]|nr:hypothetical protein [Gemmatimonadota bacterium]